jgi:hypothetical protein
MDNIKDAFQNKSLSIAIVGPPCPEQSRITTGRLSLKAF